MKNLILILLTVFIWQTGFATIHIPKDKKKKKERKERKEVTTNISLRESCEQPTDKFFQSINNVRAVLTTGGDTWTENSVGSYFVPRKENAEEEASSLYSGAVWIGGKDPGGNLKMMISGHRSSGAFDITAGPLDIATGSTEKEICDRWDIHFRVTGREIDQHLASYKEDPDLNCDSIPEGVKYWPAKGNPYFQEKYGFKLPEDHDLAPFFDRDEDDYYDPCNGDYPIIHIEAPEGKGECPPGVYADEMFFWVYNDAGSTHSKSHATPIQMEVQVEAFAWNTNDEINDMTFQRYKLINRANADIGDCYFAWWVDPDLGCSDDDYVGCVPPPVNLMFVYNSDDIDGTDGCSCDRGVNTYCDKIPMIGVDYFRGPLAHFKYGVDSLFKKDTIIVGTDTTITEVFVKLDTILLPIALDEPGDTVLELGMTSFIYYVNPTPRVSFPTQMEDPRQPDEFYNYLTGYWKDGTPITSGGTNIGYNPGSTDTVKYVFPDAPNDPNGWSMYSKNASKADYRTIQSTGPFVLKPGDVNELIIGVPWVPNVVHPGPALDQLLAADELAQSLFDNCFELQDGPDAPDIDIVELDKQLILILSNDKDESNNANEDFHEVGLKIDKDKTDDIEYKFEGYQVYQLYNGDVSVQELDDFEKARLIFQCDYKNGINTLYNWHAITNPSNNGASEKIFVPTKKVVGADAGLRHIINVEEDQFVSEGRNLVNHTPYYFMAIAYETNNWAEFKPKTGEGQREPYFPGRRNVKIYKGVPRTIAYTKLNVDPLETPEIKRIDGIGNSKYFVELTEETEQKILENNVATDLTYKEGAGPIKVEVFSPFEIQNSDYKLELLDDNMDDDVLDETAYWQLTNLSNNKVYTADTSINVSNEQVIFGEGFSVTIPQSLDKFNREEDDNGIIGSKLKYNDDNGVRWMQIIKDNSGFRQSVFAGNQIVSWDITHYLLTGEGERFHAIDPKGALNSQMDEAPFVPFILTKSEPAPVQYYVSPSSREFNGKLVKSNYLLKNEWKDLMNNVDIVFTSDKSKWSRCVVVETSYDGLFPEDLSEIPELMRPEGDAKQFRLRAAPSVSKDDNDGDGLPDPDGDGFGMGWFPGYAIDVETGERLNIFFGEASVYGGNEAIDTLFRLKKAPGRDMMFNPTSDILVRIPGELGKDIPPVYPWNYTFGGMHMVYVTHTRYDECAELRNYFSGEGSSSEVSKNMRKGLKTITWASIINTNFRDSTAVMKSYKDGLIPNDARIELRFESSYKVPNDIKTASGKLVKDMSFLKGERNGYGTYLFSFNGKAPEDVEALDKENALDQVNVVPNPYYAYSEYETSQFNKQVKITNLPGRCEITIYSIDGKFIKQINKDETGIDYRVNGSDVSNLKYKQVQSNVVWDMKNHKGIPIASGVYLIHIVSKDLGAERTIKWFGINREFDPTGL